jgi:hypothetical protein
MLPPRAVHIDGIHFKDSKRRHTIPPPISRTRWLTSRQSADPARPERGRQYQAARFAKHPEPHPGPLPRRRRLGQLCRAAVPAARCRHTSRPNQGLRLQCHPLPRHLGGNRTHGTVSSLSLLSSPQFAPAASIRCLNSDREEGYMTMIMSTTWSPFSRNARIMASGSSSIPTKTSYLTFNTQYTWLTMSPPVVPLFRRLRCSTLDTLCMRI